MVGDALGSIGAPLIDVTVQAASVKVAVGDALGDGPGDALGEGPEGVQPRAMATIDVKARTAATRPKRLDGTLLLQLTVRRAMGPV